MPIVVGVVVTVGVTDGLGLGESVGVGEGERMGAGDGLGAGAGEGEGARVGAGEGVEVGEGSGVTVSSGEGLATGSKARAEARGLNWGRRGQALTSSQRKQQVNRSARRGKFFDMQSPFVRGRCLCSG